MDRVAAQDSQTLGTDFSSSNIVALLGLPSGFCRLSMMNLASPDILRDFPKKIHNQITGTHETSS